MKTFLLILIVALLLGGIIGTSFDVFDIKTRSGYASALNIEYVYNGDKMSMRQIDSLSASSNLSFTIRNSLR